MIPYLTSKKDKSERAVVFLRNRLEERANGKHVMSLSTYNWTGVETKREAPEMDEAIVRTA